MTTGFDIINVLIIIKIYIQRAHTNARNHIITSKMNIDRRLLHLHLLRTVIIIIIIFITISYYAKHIDLLREFVHGSLMCN